MRKLVVFIACSLDGYIADAQESLRFLECVHSEDEDYGYSALYDQVDTVVFGRKTYDKVMSFGLPFPHEGKETYVFSKKEREETRYVRFIQQEPAAFVKMLKARKGGIIYCDGGGTIVSQLVEAVLIDEFIISIIPCLLGKGVRLFPENDVRHQSLTLQSSKAFPTGLVQLHYSVGKTQG